MALHVLSWQPSKTVTYRLSTQCRRATN